MPKPKMPIKTVTVELAEEGYEGFSIDVRTNAAPRLMRRYMELVSGGVEDEDEARDLLLQMFPAWKLYDDGKAIPHTREGFDDIPPDLALIMLRARTRAIQEAAMPAPLGNDSSTTPSPPTTDTPTSKEKSGNGQPTPTGA